MSWLGVNGRETSRENHVGDGRHGAHGLMGDGISMRVHGSLVFGASCLDVRTFTFCQLMGFPLNHQKLNFSQGSRKQPSNGRSHGIASTASRAPCAGQLVLSLAEYSCDLQAVAKVQGRRPVHLLAQWNRPSPSKLALLGGGGGEVGEKKRVVGWEPGTSCFLVGGLGEVGWGSQRKTAPPKQKVEFQIGVPNPPPPTKRKTRNIFLASGPKV